MAASNLTLNISLRSKWLIYPFIPIWWVQTVFGKQLWAPRFLFKIGKISSPEKGSL